MSWEWTAASLALLSTSALSLAIAIALYRRREIRGVSNLAALMLAIAYYTLIAAFEAAAVPLHRKILFSKLEYVGSGSVTVLFVLFAARFAGRTAWRTRPRVAALWLLLLFVPLAATNEFHRWIWTGFSPGAPGSNAIVYHHGPAFFAFIAAICAYLFAGSVLLIEAAIRSSAVQRRQSIACLLAAAVPWISAVLYTVGVTPAPGLNLIPLSFSVAGIVLAVGIVPLRLFELVPVARERLLESMSDGILVLDSQRRLVDLNPSARAMFRLPRSAIGTDAARLLAAWPSILEHLDPKREVRLELSLYQKPLYHADLRITPLRTTLEASPGHLIVVRDITRRHLAETALRAANEHLQAQLREIERLQEELREQAIRDALTGLFNRRHLDDMLPRILARAERDGAPVSVALVDIDHFKQANDTYGHRAGDALLAELGGLLSRQARPGDIACRYGGEEFVLVFPGMPLETAVERMDGLRRTFRAADLRALGIERPPTLSAGIAVFPEHGASQDELLRAADAALYQAKASGRDCVRVAGEPAA